VSLGGERLPRRAHLHGVEVLMPRPLPIVMLALAAQTAACATARPSPGSAGAPAPAASAPGATAAGHAATEAPPRQPGTAADMAAICPVAVPGTVVATLDTPEGEALVFTTASGQVEELRRRVHAVAGMHNSHHPALSGTGTDPTGMPATDVQHPGAPPAATATAEDVPEGARLVLKASNPGDVDRLRSSVRAHAQRLQREGCGG
jgi:hypothetical protein